MCHLSMLKGLIDVVLHVGPIRTPQDFLFIWHAQVPTRKINQDSLKTITNLHYALALGVLHWARVEAYALVLLLSYDLGQLQHPPLPLLLMLAHHKVHLKTDASRGCLILETIF